MTTATQLLRNRSTRGLWDPNYVDESWINATVELIPRLKNWVATYYFPDTPVAITEYNRGAESDINGATAQADIFGIFGREGLDLATRWTAPDPSTPTYLAMKMYRNYDGAKSSFGDTSVSATVANPDQLSAFAAQRSSDEALTVTVINKDRFEKLRRHRQSARVPVDHGECDAATRGFDLLPLDIDLSAALDHERRQHFTTPAVNTRAGARLAVSLDRPSFQPQETICRRCRS